MAYTPAILQLRISLVEVDPPIWRRVLVPSDLTLTRLHDVIQVAMGWQDSHLYEFEVGDRRYGVPNPGFRDPDFKVHRDSSIKMEAIVRRGIERFTYVYDFGDHWVHEIVIEQSRPFTADLLYPAFIEGERRCPPEDVGGVFGFFEFLEAIQDPHHEDHAHLLDWVGGIYDPDTFDYRSDQSRHGEYRPPPATGTAKEAILNGRTAKRAALTA